MKSLTQKNVILIILFISQGIFISKAQTSKNNDPRFTFPIPDRENNSMAAFQRNASGLNLVNAYILAKLSDLVYVESLDYQIRFMRNGQEPLNYTSSAAVTRDGIVTNQNLEKAIAARCFHWFLDENNRPKRPVPTPYQDTLRFKLVDNDRSSKINNNKDLIAAKADPALNETKTFESIPDKGNVKPVIDYRKPTPPAVDSSKVEKTAWQQMYESKLQRYLEDSANWEKENYPVFKFLRRNLTVAFKLFDNIVPVAAWDPELLVISHKDLVIIVFRGTDGGLGTPRGEMDMGEWLGSNLAAVQTKIESGPFANTWIHGGFYGAFNFIAPDITQYLQSIRALETGKKIWVTGHSLGGAMAQLTGLFLKKKGFNVQGVYTYASPRVIGNGDFVRLQDETLGARLQRFEYYLDPVTLIYAPGYSIGGTRNWIDHKDKGCSTGDNCYVMHRNVAERYVSLNPCEFNRCLGDSRSEEAVRMARAMKSGMLTDHPVRMIDHSAQWYVKSMWHQLSSSQQSNLPRVNDSWPFLYVSGPK